MYNIIYEMNRQSKFDALYRMLGVVHWDDPEGWHGEGGGRWVQDGEHMYTCGRFMLMVRWHHQLNGHEFEQIPGDGVGQGRLVCYSPWGCKESDMTEQLNNNKMYLTKDRKQREEER